MKLLPRLYTKTHKWSRSICLSCVVKLNKCLKNKNSLLEICSPNKNTGQQKSSLSQKNQQHRVSSKILIFSEHYVYVVEEPHFITNVLKVGYAVAILEWKNWGGHCGAKEKIRGGNIIVSPAWWFSVVMKIDLLWLTLPNSGDSRIKKVGGTAGPRKK